MALTARGRTLALGAGTIVAAASIVTFLVAGGNGEPLSQSTAAPSATSTTRTTAPSPSATTPAPPPAFCPLSGVKPDGGVPLRPVLAVKVENLPAARPQMGLSWADLVYEEPVEGGITRFIALYQCQDASRIEPIRSARLSDPDLLVQFGRPIIAYSGAVPQVVRAIDDAGLFGLTEDSTPAAFHRDLERQAPHNLYSSTDALYGAAASAEGPPSPIFTFSSQPAVGGKHVAEVTVPMTFAETISWRWDDSEGVWVRYDGGQPHLLSDGTPITAKNVVVQLVKTELTYVVDPETGARSPKVISVGTGTVYVLRAGRMYTGTWSRPDLAAPTRYLFDTGNPIPLAAGNTWVELAPEDAQVTST